MTVLEFIVDGSVELEVVAEIAMTVSEFVVDRTMTEVEREIPFILLEFVANGDMMLETPYVGVIAALEFAIQVVVDGGVVLELLT